MGRMVKCCGKLCAQQLVQTLKLDDFVIHQGDLHGIPSFSSL